jgi:hypothetical protein
MRCAVAKPKPTLHEKALKVFGVIKRTPKEEKAHEVDVYFFARRKEEIANHIKPVLEEMDAAFKRGEIIGGAPSLKIWCRMYKYIGNALSYARCRQILTGKTGHEGKSVKPLDLKEGVVVGFKGVKYTVDKAALQSRTIHLIVTQVEEPQTQVSQATKIPAEQQMLEHAKKEGRKSRQSRIDNAERKKKLTAAQTAEAIYANEMAYKDENKDDHSVEWARNYQREFEKGVAPEHPEWRKHQVEKESMRILTMIHARTVMREEPLSEPAKALAATVDGATVSYDTVAYAKAKNWSQKVCIPGSPENEEWRKDLLYRREHPPIDPNADDEFAGEGD